MTEQGYAALGIVLLALVLLLLETFTIEESHA